MSEHLPAAAEAASTIDWKVVGEAAGLFLATMVTTVFGWMKGQDKAKEKHESHIKPEGSDIMVAGAVLQDNQSLRENTESNKQLRDQIMLQTHALERLCRSIEELNNAVEDMTDQTRRQRVR